MLKITYDPMVDALYISFRDTTVTTKQLENGLAVDYDSEGNLAGIEVLDASARMGGRKALESVLIEELPMAADT
jgi:uncharacterized protein YuzE